MTALKFLLALLFLLSLPVFVAASYEWSLDIALWSKWTRLLAALSWVAIFLFVASLVAEALSPRPRMEG